MNNQTEKMLTTSWNLVRDAGSAVGDAAINADVGGKLMRTLPKVKELVSAGAGLALARRGSRVAVAVVKRNPVLAIASAVALAGVGLAVAVVKRRKAAAENGDASVARPRRIVAKNVRGNSRTVIEKPATKKVAKTARPRKTRTTVSKSTS